MSTDTDNQTRPTFIEQPFYSPEEFSAGLGVSRATTYRLLKDGQLKSVKFMGSRRIPHTEYARLAGEAV